MNIPTRIIRHYLKYHSGYELSEKQNWLPTPTFDNIKLVLALYKMIEPSATFVQIGAYDGKTDDPTSEFVLGGEMRCLLVEPIEESFQKLNNIYAGKSNVSLMRAAIGHSDGNAILFKIKKGSHSDSILTGGLASFNKAHLLKHHIRKEDIEPVTVPSLTLKSLLAKFCLEKVDIMQIDTEGFDAEIVKMALALPIPPDCLNFENLHLSRDVKKELYALLTKCGYVYSHYKFNTMALHRRWIDGLLAIAGGSKAQSNF
jgi:FkbM family methyltransferase